LTWITATLSLETGEPLPQSGPLAELQPPEDLINFVAAGMNAYKIGPTAVPFYLWIVQIRGRFREVRYESKYLIVGDGYGQEIRVFDRFVIGGPHDGSP
jgi:hypothetical protein